MKKLSVLLTLLMAFMCVPLANAWDFYYDNPITQIFNESASKDLGQLQTREDGGYKYYFVDFTPESDSDIEFKFVFNNGNGSTWCGAEETVTSGSGWVSLTTEDQSKKNKLTGLTSGVSHRLEIRVADSKKDVVEAKLAKVTGDVTTGSKDYYLWSNIGGNWTTTGIKFSGSPLTCTVENPGGYDFGIKVTNANAAPDDGDPWYITNPQNITPSYDGVTDYALESASQKNGQFNNSINAGRYTLILSVDDNDNPVKLTIVGPNGSLGTLGGAYTIHAVNQWGEPVTGDFGLSENGDVFVGTVDFRTGLMTATEFVINYTKDGRTYSYSVNEGNTTASAFQTTTFSSLKVDGTPFRMTAGAKAVATFTLAVDEEGFPTALTVAPFAPLPDGYCPETLYIWIDGTPRAMNFDESTKRFNYKYNYTANSNLAFSFSEKDGQNWLDRGVLFFNNADDNLVKHAPVEIYNMRTRDEDPNHYFRFSNSEDDPLNIIVDFSGSPATVEACTDPVNNHTVYFIDKSNGAKGDVLAHFYRTENNQPVIYKAWTDPAQKMTDTYSYVKVDNNYYPVYSYTFKWKNEAQNVIFHFADDSQFNAEYVRGAYYYIDGDKAMIEENPQFADKPSTAVGEVPSNLWLRVFRNNVTYEYEMTYDKAGKFTGIVPGSSADTYFRMNVKNDNGTLIKTYGAPSKDYPISFNDTKADELAAHQNLNIYDNDSESGTYKGDFHTLNVNDNDKWEGDFYVIADFTTEPRTITVMPAYYFIGDQNKWFSKEFDGDPTQGINATERDNNKAAWVFEPECKNGKYTGWYMFNNFPDAEKRLLGQFQIFNGMDWNEKSTFSHTIKIADNDWTNAQYKLYYDRKLQITQDGEEQKYNTVRRGQGQNLHMPCNAVQGATILFNPATSQIVVMGTKRDYFIFYNMSLDMNNPQLRAHINPEKPNHNNYYLPFNTVERVVNGNTESKQFYAGDPDHMNNTASEAWDENGKAMYHMDLLKAYANGELDQIFAMAPDVRTAIENGTLPNGRKLKEGEEIWFAKIPNGFANPAGTKFAVAFRNSQDPENYRDGEKKELPFWTPLGAEHLYFFDGRIHVHLNTEKSFSDEYDTQVSYRVYSYDIDYNTVLLHPDWKNKSTEEMLVKLVEKGHRPTAETNTMHDDCWVTLTDNHIEGTWESAAEASETFGRDSWRIALDSEVAAADNSEVSRKEIPGAYGSAYVQFRIRIAPKGQLNAQGRAAAPSFQQYDVYYPELPTIGQSEDEKRMSGSDYYLVTDDSGVWTAVKDILDDMYDNGNIDDSDAAPVYYNLQGARVENPDKGIYIKVTGSKSEKVLF